MTENQTPSGERIAKVMARAGLCSRREAEEWIAAGRVAVNGKVLDSPAFNVGPDDRVSVDGAPLTKRERTRLFLFHKPRGTVTTAHDPQGRPTVFDALPANLPRVVTVGRLDINTEGLLLLTNDGGLARALELPSTGWLRRYRVRAHGDTDQAVLDTLREGVTVDGVDYRGIEARLDREQGANVWLTIGLREGKNREVRKVLEHIGLEVNRLIRVSFGPFQLGDLGEGAVEEVKTRILKDQLGDKIASLANADFDAPLYDGEPARGRRDGGDRQNDRQGDRRSGKRGEKSSRERRGDGKGERRAGWVREDRGTRDRRPFEEEAEVPRREKPQAGKRKHVSVLREQSAEQARGKGDRKRIERGETADRRGRAVPVERVVAAGRTQSEADAPRKSARNAERFAKMRGEGRPERREEPRQRGGERNPERTGGGAPMRKPRARPERDGERAYGEKFRSRRDATDGTAEGSERKPWKDKGRDGPRKSFEKRGERADRPDRRDGKGPGKRSEHPAGREGPARKFRARDEGRDGNERNFAGKTGFGGPGRTRDRDGGKPFGKDGPRRDRPARAGGKGPDRPRGRPGGGNGGGAQRGRPPRRDR